MSEKIFNVLFVCRRNSARSIMAEAILQREGFGRFNAYSAGSDPEANIDPITQELLQQFNHPTEKLTPKTWDQFVGEDTPEMDFVFSIDENIANENCPDWSGDPMFAQWGIPDPVGFDGTDVETRALFNDVYGRISNRVSIFVNLRVDALDRLSLQKSLDAIGGP